MCGSYGTQKLTWSNVAELARLTTNEPLPTFSEQDRFPLGKKAVDSALENCERLKWVDFSPYGGVMPVARNFRFRL